MATGERGGPNLMYLLWVYQPLLAGQGLQKIGTYICTYKGKEKTYTLPRAPETCNWAVWFPDLQRLATGRFGLVLWVGSAHREMAAHFRSQSTHHYYTRKQDTLGSGRPVGISRPHTACTWQRCKKTTPDRGF